MFKHRSSSTLGGVSRKTVNRVLVASQLNGAGSMDIQHIHGKVHLTGGFLPMRWACRDYREVPISMVICHKVHIHRDARNIHGVDNPPG